MYSLEAAMRLAAEADFAAVELAMCPEVWLRGTAPVRRSAERYGLKIATVHQSLYSTSPTGGGARRMIDAARGAVELGAPAVVIHAPGAKRWEDAGAQRWLRALDSAQQVIAGSGTRLALENPGARPKRGAADVLSRIDDLVACARRYDLDLTFDTCHAGTAGIDLLATYEAMRERLVNVHFSDLRSLRLPWHLPLVDIVWAHHQLPGDGRLDLAPLVQRLAADGYPGSVTAEVSFMALAFWSPRRAVVRLRRLTEFVRAHAATSVPGDG